MGWTSKPSAVCWGTTMQALPCEPTPTPQGRSRMKLHKRWAASWRRSCKQKKDAKYRRGGKTSSPVLFEPIRTFSRVGHGVGQAVDPHFDPHIFQHFCNKKHRKPKFSMLFWSCWADSNCRPHPYQGCALPTELQQQMATRKGFEPSTSGVTGRRSNQLNYLAEFMVGTTGLEPVTLCL